MHLHLRLIVQSQRLEDMLCGGCSALDVAVVCPVGLGTAPQVMNIHVAKECGWYLAAIGSVEQKEEINVHKHKRWCGKTTETYPGFRQYTEIGGLQGST